MNPFLSMIEVIGKQAAAQLSGPWAFLAGFVLKVAVKILDYYKIKHELKTTEEKKLQDFENAIKDLSLTDEQRDQARKDFLR